MGVFALGSARGWRPKIRHEQLIELGDRVDLRDAQTAIRSSLVERHTFERVPAIRV